MSLQNIVNGAYGFVIDLTVQQDGVAQDISAFSAVTFLFEDPDGVVISHVAGFKTDGSEGIVRYTVADGDIDQEGNWRVQVVLSSASASVPTRWLGFRVESKLE